MTSRSRIGVVGMTLSLLSLGAVAVAQTHERTVASTQSAARQEQEVRPGASSREHDGDIYGYQLMTERERGEYRERLRAATSDRELSRVRSEHRARMQAPGFFRQFAYTFSTKVSTCCTISSGVKIMPPMRP